MYSVYGDISSRYRVAPFGYPRFEACVRLTVAFRSLPRPSSAPGAKASTLRSYWLDLSCAQRTRLNGFVLIRTLVFRLLPLQITLGCLVE